MTECERIPDTNREAICIRNSLAEKLWLEMQGNGVSLLNYVFYELLELFLISIAVFIADIFWLFWR